MYGSCKESIATAFVNTGQWVKHKPHDCRVEKRQQEQKDERNASSETSNSVNPCPATLVNVAIPLTTPPVGIPPLTYVGVASGKTLPMQAKLEALIDNADPSKMASLYAAAMGDELGIGEEL